MPEPTPTPKGRRPIIPHSAPAAGTTVYDVAQEEPAHPAVRLLKILGPGLITGASDDDPSGIATYSIAGASLGYSTLWVALVTFPLQAAVQFICAKIGMVTGRGLAGVVRLHYPPALLYSAVACLFIANTINAGADIGAIAAAINLLLPIPVVWLILPVAMTILTLQIWCSYRQIANTFKWLSLALLAYIASAFFSHPDLSEVLRGTFVPTVSLDSTFLSTLVALLGTTISPYLFFWQASQEVEEEIEQGRKSIWQREGASKAELKYRAWDVNTGMFLSNLVMFFIILATGATLFKSGDTNISTAADAARALEPVAGPAAKVLLAVGLIGAGFLAVPILTGSAAYAISEAFGWRYGFDQKPGRAKQFYGVIAVATLIGMLINFIGIDPVSALFWTSVINGFLAPPLLVLIMVVSNNRSIMGDRVNNTWINVLGWATTVAMFAAAAGLLSTWKP